LARCKSGIGFNEYGSKQNKTNTIIKNNPLFVDYSETISNWESKFDRAITTPNKDASENLSTTSKATQRRTRQMRKMNSTSKKAYQFADTSESMIIIEKVNKHHHEAEKKLNESYYYQKEKRDHTPALWKRSRLFHRESEKINQVSNLNAHISNLKKVDHLSRNDNEAKDSTSYIVSENIRLSLYTSCRMITLKHLNSLWSKSTPEIRQVMKLFWMLLNALKKPEYQVDSSVYKNWTYLWEYINNHNWTILAEVIAISNKIQRELYSEIAMLEVKDQFEKLEISENMDSSFTTLHTLIKHSIAFFTSKQESK